MMKKRTFILSVIVVFVMVSSFFIKFYVVNDWKNYKGANSPMENQTFPNPLIEHRADPWIYKHTDGYYYFTASVPEYDRIILRKAGTIEGLSHAREVTIWKKHDSDEMSVHIWAPELHYLDGKWYIYYAAGGLGGDKWGIRPYVLECSESDPTSGAWIEKGMMQKSRDDTFSSYNIFCKQQ